MLGMDFSSCRSRRRTCKVTSVPPRTLGVALIVASCVIACGDAFFPLPTPRCALVSGGRGTKSHHDIANASGSRPSPSVRRELSSSAREGEVLVSRTDGREDGSSQEYRLAYRIARPMNLSSRQAAPVVVLHGGPSVPSDYLYPLEGALPYRSVVYYDQLGCGRSDEPRRGGESGGNSAECYSIDLAVDDLEAVLKKLGIRRFHLYGQSFGGILAFEYMKRAAEQIGEGSRSRDEPECLSAVMSSSPTNVKRVEVVAERLVTALAQGAAEGDDVAELFRLSHQCRTPEMPQPLKDAYAAAGSVWRGTDAISDYIAKPPSDNAARMPSTMVMRGEHDFLTDECVRDWKDVFNHQFVRFKELEGCSHHGLLEKPTVYGDVVDSYFSEYD